MYYHEIDQKDKINARIAIPNGLISVFVGVGAYYIKNIDTLTSGACKTLFIILLFFYGIGMSFAIYYLFRAYHGYTYRYLPYASEIANNANYWEDYYNNYYDQYFNHEGGPSKDALIEEAVNNEICKLYQEAIEVNQYQNELKLKYLRIITYPLTVVLIIGILAYVPFYYSHDNNQITKVEIVNLKMIQGGVIMAEEQDRTENKSADKNPPDPNPPKIETRMIHENFELDPSKTLKKEKDN